MHPMLRATLVATIILAGATVLRAQQPLSVPSASGREFWLAFQTNFRDFVTNDRTGAQMPAAELELELFIASAFSASGRVEIPGLDFRSEFTIAPGRIVVVAIPKEAQLRASGVVEKLAVHVVADQPVTVYGLNRRYQTSETFLAIPVESLGTEYRAMAFRKLQNDLIAQMAVVATEDNTVVTITSPAPLRQFAAGDAGDADATVDSASRARVVVGGGRTVEVRLDRGEALQLVPRYDPKLESDLTGALVRSSKPVAVFSGHNCAYVPDLTVKACNLLAEQMPPTKSWGTTFGVGAIAGRSYSVLRAVARHDSTIVSINGKEVATLRAGEHVEHRLVGNAVVVASRPVLLAQFSPGFDNGDGVGDPMMIVLPPLEQFDNVYSIATPVNSSFRHYITIVARTEAIDGLSIDTHPVDRTRFAPIGNGDYSVGSLEISYGMHVIGGREAFGLYQYGLGFDDAAYDAYGNAGGQLFLDLDAAIEPGGRQGQLPDIGLLTR